MRASGSQPERDHPEDEFDTDFTPGQRRGAHRTSGSLVEGLPWVLAALLTVAVIVSVLVLLTRPDGAPPVADGAGATSASTTAAPDDPASSSPPTSTQPTTSSTASSTPTTSTTSSEPTPSATIDQAEPLTVLNGTFTAGLAGEVAAALEEQGWTVTSVDNFPERPQAFTSVFYSAEEDAATAEAVAEDVGGRAVRQAANDGPLTVVIADDYEP